MPKHYDRVPTGAVLPTSAERGELFLMEGTNQLQVRTDAWNGVGGGGLPVVACRNFTATGQISHGAWPYASFSAGVYPQHDPNNEFTLFDIGGGTNLIRNTNAGFFIFIAEAELTSPVDADIRFAFEILADDADKWPFVYQNWAIEPSWSATLPWKGNLVMPTYLPAACNNGIDYVGGHTPSPAASVTFTLWCLKVGV